MLKVSVLYISGTIPTEQCKDQSIVSTSTFFVPHQSQLHKNRVVPHRLPSFVPRLYLCVLLILSTVKHTGKAGNEAREVL